MINLFFTCFYLCFPLFCQKYGTAQKCCAKPLCTKSKTENGWFHLLYYYGLGSFLNTVPLYMYGVDTKVPLPKRTHRFDSCLTFRPPFLHPIRQYEPTLPPPPIPSPNPKRHTAPCLCRTGAAPATSASTLRPRCRRRRRRRRRRRHQGAPAARTRRRGARRRRPSRAARARRGGRAGEEEADRELAPARAGVRLPRLAARRLKK
jgi:hypothetical protein